MQEMVEQKNEVYKDFRNMYCKIICLHCSSYEDYLANRSSGLFGVLRGPTSKKRPMISGSKIESADFYLPSKSYRVLFKMIFFCFSFALNQNIEPQTFPIR